MFDYSEVNAKETSRAWNRFVADRDAPSVPMTGVRSMIYQSWLRSTSTGIKPEQYAAPTLDSVPQARKSKHDNSDLRRATQESLMHIGGMLSGAEAILLLTDRDGVILDTVGDTSTLDKANRINLRVGGIWSEQASGTNGIGTALWAGQPVFVHGEEHFCEGMKAWSCACAPIRDPVDRSIIGAINLSGLTAIFQKHNAAFAATAAREIEIALEREQSILHLHLLESIIGTVPMQSGPTGEGIAVVDRFGRLIFNRNCGSLPQFAGSGAVVKNGTKLFNLSAELSEASILSALPVDHTCQEIRLINIEGVVKGAALVFKSPNHVTRPTTRLAPLPGTVLRGTDLKIVGKSDAILEAVDTANRIATARLPILIEGQTGVGKELFARLIHSQLPPQLFAAVNCGAASVATLGAALEGAMSVACAPTLVLDEIGELPAEIQPFLLRALEQRSNGQADDGHGLSVISLTNRVMLDEVEAGRFRRDLFYRLGTITLTIPPLSERGDDILLIAEHYNRKISIESGREVLILRSDAQEALMTHNWPGNVRELRNVISGLHFLSKDRTITLTDLPRDLVQRRVPALSSPAIEGANPESLKEAESQIIRATLTAQRGNLSRTAAMLGISRPTLYRKMDAYKIAVRKPG
ncbi:MAG: sigma 54-interacting transcriptional regulator [Paracoccaceae bacterium]